MTNDYREAARRIISDLGRGRASELLELLDNPDVGALIKDELRSALDEARVLNALQLMSDVHEALDEISWKPQEVISGGQLAQALRLELDSGHERVLLTMASMRCSVTHSGRSTRVRRGAARPLSQQSPR